MIRYQRHESGMFPRFFCDTCNKPIEDDTGFVFWDREGRTAHAHMGPCAHALSQVSGGDAWPYSESLVLFLSNLLCNTRITLKKLKEPHPMRDIFGRVGSRKELNRGV